MNCKDCLHYEACKLTIKQLEGIKVAALLDDDYWCNAFANSCTIYSDKSEWVHLPCKVGDNVYCFEPSFNQMRKPGLKVLKTKIIDVKTTMTVYGLNFNLDDVGKTAFLTREEAEKALVERNRK